MNDILKYIAASIIILLPLSGQAYLLDNAETSLVCKITKQYICDINNCIHNHSNITIKVSKKHNGALFYERCDSKGCDSYLAMQQHSGIYTIIRPQKRSSQFKMRITDGGFMEIATLHLKTFIGFGKCVRDEFDLPLNFQKR